MTKVDWISGSGSRIDLLSFLGQSRSRGHSTKIYVGSDSHRSRKLDRIVVLSTAVCLWSGDGQQSSDGGLFCYRKSLIPVKVLPAMSVRLLRETSESVEVASLIRRLGFHVDEVHVNVSLDPDDMSSRYTASLRGLVEGSGFRCVVKPDDWAAGGVADRFAR